MTTSDLGFELRDGADVAHGRRGERYVEFFVDGVSLRDVVGTSTELVPFVWMDLGVGDGLRELRRLRRHDASEVDEAVPVLVCAMCGDLECGAVVARVVADDEVVRWSLAEVNFDFSRPDPRVEVRVPGTAELSFEAVAYDAVLERVRRELMSAAGRGRPRGMPSGPPLGDVDGRTSSVPTPWGGTLSPAEDPAILRRHLRRHVRVDRACPFCADVGDTVVAIMRMEAHDIPDEPIEVGELGWVTDIGRAAGCLPFSRRLGTDEVLLTFGPDGSRWTLCGPGDVLKVTSPRSRPGRSDG